ncbi:tripartite tricarboxylate transporter substrate binding protein BugE [soil metagenome]
MRIFSKPIKSLAVVLCLWAAASAQAQTFPNKPIRIIVPFGASSGLDPIGRGIGERLAEQMGVPVFVENREGAGGQVGVMAAVASPPDGSTIIIVVNPPYAAAPYMRAKLPYDPLTDLTPIARVVTTPLMLIASNQSGLNTFSEMVQVAKSQPGKLSYGSSGVGTASHLKMEQIKLVDKLDIKFVPYKSTGQQMMDTVGGQLDLSFPSLAGGLPQVQSGKVRALAIGSPQRNPLLPAVPTLAEATGKPGLEAVVWYAFMGPKGMPHDVVARLASEIEKALDTPAMAKVAETLGAERSFLGPVGFTEQVRKSAEESRSLIKELNIMVQE